MYILVINSGSSSIKFALIQGEDKSKRYWGQVEGIGTDQALFSFAKENSEEKFELGKVDHNQAIDALLNKLTNQSPQIQISGVGHRIVHGGELFSKPQRIDAKVVEDIRGLIPLAPLHNPGHLMGIEATLKAFPTTPQFAIFDTAFHQSIPSPNYLYPIKYEYYEKYAARKYGFHGISYEFLLTKLSDLGLDPKGSYLMAHLGNGCSASAVQDGKCVDTTMGLTPLEGLMMGTRSGSVDPGLIQFLTNATGKSLEEITMELNKESGLKGVSGISQDMRTLSECASENESAQLALDLFHFRLAKELMGLVTSLDKLDAVIFTGGIGENNSTTRKLVIEKLKLLNLKIDDQLNTAKFTSSAMNINEKGTTPILVIRAGEEEQIAIHVIKELEK